MEYYPAVEMNGLWVRAMAGMTLTIIFLKEAGQRAPTVPFNLYKTLEKTNQYIVTECRPEVAWMSKGQKGTHG